MKWGFVIVGYSKVEIERGKRSDHGDPLDGVHRAQVCFVVGILLFEAVLSA